jgi:hypothetical protein
VAVVGPAPIHDVAAAVISMLGELSGARHETDFATRAASLAQPTVVDVRNGPAEGAGVERGVAERLPAPALPSVPAVPLAHAMLLCVALVSLMMRRDRLRGTRRT